MLPLNLLGFFPAILSRLGFGGCVAMVMAMLLGVQSVRLAMADHWISNAKSAQIAAKADVKAHESQGVVISSEAKAELAAERAHVQTVTRTLIQKVPVYVDAKADAACTVGDGFVSVFDAAARGDATLPRPPGGSGGSPSGVPLSAVLATTVEDFGVAYDWRAEALKWRSWYAREAANWTSRK